LGPRSRLSQASHAAFSTHRILRLRAGAALAVRGSVHKGSSLVLLSSSARAPVRFLGEELGTDSLMLAGTEANIDFYVPSGAVVSLLVAESQECISRRGLWLCKRANTNVPGLTELAEYMGLTDHNRSEVDASLARQLRDAVKAAGIVEVDPSVRTQGIAAVAVACRVIERRLPEPIKLGDLCRACEVSARTLEYGFRQVYDTTPIAFIRSQRLTRSRSALLRAASHASISATARACGFTHMGQYSRDYRRLFGETPSLTLARRQH